MVQCRNPTGKDKGGYHRLFKLEKCQFYSASILENLLPNHKCYCWAVKSPLSSCRQRTLLLFIKAKSTSVTRTGLSKRVDFSPSYFTLTEPTT